MVLALACSLLARNAVLRLFIKSIVFCATNPSAVSLCCSLEISLLPDAAPFLLALFCTKFKELSSGGVARFCVECTEFKELSRIAAKFSLTPLSTGAAEFAESLKFIAALLSPPFCAKFKSSPKEAAAFSLLFAAASKLSLPKRLEFAGPPFACASFLAALLICARVSEAAIFFCASAVASETISPTDLWFDLRAELEFGLA